MYAHFVSKENLFGLCSLLNDQNPFLNKYCNLPFLAISFPYFPSLYFLCHPGVKKQKMGYERACEPRK